MTNLSEESDGNVRSGARLQSLADRVVSVVRKVERLGLPLASWPSARLVSWINAAQVTVWTAIAIAVLPNRGHFTYDQAYFYELSVRTAETLQPPAYGPFVSDTFPAVMTPGGSLYLVYSIPFFLFRDPRVGMGWVILLSAGGLWLIDRSFARLEVPTSLRLALVTTLTWSMWHGRFTDTFWNANFFLFSTPALLYVSTLNSTDAKPSWWWSALFGVLSGLSLQIHASGSLAILACGLLWATRRPETLTPARIGLVLSGILVTYVPYLIVEFRDHWVNSRALRGAIPVGFNPIALRKSLGAWFLYPSHAQTRQALSSFWSGPWYDKFFGASLAASIPLTALGLFVRFPSKMTALLMIPALPLYFLVTGRPYYDHYVVAAMPFLCLFGAAGAAWLLSQHLLRWLAIAYFVAFAGAGTALLLAGQQVLRPGDPWNGHTVGFQLDRTRRAIARGAPVPSGSWDEGAFVEWVVARRLFHHSLMFQVGPYQCDVDLRLSGTGAPVWQRTNKVLIPLASNSVFVCGASAQ